MNTPTETALQPLSRRVYALLLAVDAESKREDWSDEARGDFDKAAGPLLAALPHVKRAELRSAGRADR